MDLILVAWLSFVAIFLSVPAAYYLYLRRVASRPWKLKIDRTYTPPITIIIPTHNEEKVIGFKLANLSSVTYPKEKLQIILADDASADNTIQEASKFVNCHREMNVKILSAPNREGKSAVLNLALKHARHDVIVVSDADTFWAPNVLIEALPYLSDPSVGAVSGRQKLLNFQHSLLTQTEKIYLDLTYEVVKLGESKIHSTILFHGLFSAYKRDFLNEFNLKTDDSGTALDIVQKGARTLYVPEAICFEIFPVTWRSKIYTKVRRASQLVQIYAKCLKLLVNERLLLPRKIAVPEIFLYLFNPLVFLLLTLTTFVVIFEYLPNSLILVLILLLLLVIPKCKPLFVEVIQDNCILLWALFAFTLGRKFIVWKTQEESRSVVTEEMLKRERLI